jgi:HSP20 family protein
MKSWDPFRDLLTIQDRMNKLFESVLTGPVPVDADGDNVSAWRPSASVVETEDSLRIECELPGVERSGIDVSVEGRHLVVQGERPRPEGSEAWTYHQIERPYGKFVRKFELPEGLDLDSVEARLEHGVLTVSLPKKPEARSRHVDVG